MSNTRNKKRKKINKNKRTFIIIFLLILISLITVISFFVSSYVKSLSENVQKIPIVMEELSINVPEASQIFDSEGKLIAIIHLGERRFYTQLKDISPFLVKAIVSTEDVRFYNHYGIDIRGIFRALWLNLRTGTIAEGASTITQQLARDLFNLTLEKTWERKTKEIIIALQLEREYSKDEILEMYLNIYFLGEGNYGVEAASRYYFGKSARDLTLAESAMIAGIFTAPSRLNPKTNYEGAKSRMMVVLNRMLKNTAISDEEYKQAEENPPVVKSLEETFTSSVQYFTDYVKDYLQKLLPRDVLFGGGLKIYTNLNHEIQVNLEKALNSQLENLVKEKAIKEYKDDKDVRQPQGALIAINPQTGEILGMVGGRNYKETPLNRVFSLRQPGSTFKAFVYAAALESKLVTPLTILDSEPITLKTPAGTWTPTEYVRIEGKNFYGPMDVRDALVRSSNIVAIKVALARGLADIISYAQRMGINTKLEEVFSLPIGSNDVTLFELSFAYSVLANAGYKVEPLPVKLVTTAKGVKIKEFTTVKSKVLSEEAAYILTDIFKDVAKKELRGGMKVNFPSAGKTGTSDKHRDAWFIGYSPNLLVGVWTGMDNEIAEANMVYNSGLFAQKIWQHAVVPYLSGREVLDFAKPPGVEELFICNISRMIATPSCPANNIRREVFFPSSSPKQYCNKH